MVASWETWLQRLVLARSAAAAGPEPAPSPTPSAVRLFGEPQRVTRLLVVRPGTVALLLRPGLEPQLRLPGELLVPALLAPSAPPVVVLPVHTGPVELDVTVADLVTYDGHAVHHVVLRLTVRLDDLDGYAELRSLAADHPDDLEPAVLAAVHRQVAHAVRGALRMNWLADLRRFDLADVLHERWLPSRFGSDTLVLEALRVQRVHWPDEDEATVPVVALPG